MGRPGPDALAGERRLRVADAARLCGVSPSTLRLWEQHGLLRPQYSSGGQRLFGPADLARIRAIRRLRSAQGLSLAAIRAMGSTPSGTRQAGGGDSHPPGGLGPRLRALRRRAGLSLRQVAAATGLAPSFVSTLERTSLGASAASLRKLARCYGTTVTRLSVEDESADGAAAVVHAGEARVLPMLGPAIRVEQLARGRRMMDCQKWTLQPGAASDGAYSHEGEEFIHVLAGALELILDGRERHRLAAGDSIYFLSTRPHAWRNPGEAPAVLLWVNTPPSF